MKRLSSYSLGTAASVLIFTSAGVAFAQPTTRPQMSWHWHVHQPNYWNGPSRAAGAPDRVEFAWESIQQKDGGDPHPTNDLRGIFGLDDRIAAYQFRMRDSLGTIGGYTRSGVAVSYSGALIENVNSIGDASQLGFSPGWNGALNQANDWTTASGYKRLEFTNFSAHHGLLALLPAETSSMSIRLQQEILKREFGADSISKGFFPTEMAFSTRLIPILKDLGIEWSIVSGEHIARACPDFPVVLGSGGVGCDPPNSADQINPAGVEFIRETIQRGCSPVNANPLSYQPSYMKRVNPETGVEDFLIAVPADQATGWLEGYGPIGTNFLQRLEARNNPAQPSLVLMSHDGDNAYAGGFSYYMENVSALANSANALGNGVTSIQQYLHDFPPSAAKVIHVEDGAWVNADGDFGSPSFINWNYPLLDASGNHDPVNGWHEKVREMAIFVAAEQRILAAEKVTPAYTRNMAKIMTPDAGTHPIDRAWHYHLASFDSGNVYYGTVEDFEIKGTLGANEVARLVDPIIAGGSADATKPTVWVPQRFPWNPGSLNFGVAYAGNATLYPGRQYINNGDFHIWTFVSDTAGPADAVLKYRIDADGANPLSTNQNETFAGGAEVGSWVSLPMAGREFPKTNIYGKGGLDYFILPNHIARHYSAPITGLRSVLIDYYVEATDSTGNVTKSDIQHVYIGDGSGSTGGGGGTVVVAEPNPPVRGEQVAITYDPAGRPLASSPEVHIHLGKNNWVGGAQTPRPAMILSGDKWTHTFTVDPDALDLKMVFTTAGTGNAGQWDNNGGADWTFVTTGDPVATPTVAPDANPFAMDGTLDSNACDVDGTGRLYVAEANGWLYIAANGSLPNDHFIYLSPDPTTLINVNWAKAGQVGTWSHFLAVEGNGGNFSSWYGATQNQLADSAASYVHARNGVFVEGAIRKNLVGTGSAFVALGIYGTNDAGALQIQSPPTQNGNGNIDGTEFVEVVTGVSLCTAASPTPSLTATTPPPTTTTPASTTAPTTPPPSATPTVTPPPASRRITIGPGDQIGETAGQVFFEELQDWEYGDCRAIDAYGDSVNLGGGENARDLVSFSSFDDDEAGTFYMRADFFDLFLEAENSVLDLYVLMDFGTPTVGATAWPDGVNGAVAEQWDLSLALYSGQFWNIRAANGSVLSSQDSNALRFRGAYYRSDLDAVELGIDRALLTENGWDGVSPINFQIGTTRDFNPALADRLPDSGSIASTSSCPTAKFAYVLHGNQAISPADYIQQLVHNTTVTTPGGNPTGYRRALESARIFGAAPNIHVSATLLSSAMWAAKADPNAPDDGPSFVREIADFLDGDSTNGEGAVIWGVYSEHIMPFFEGTMNQDSIALNDDYLQSVLGIGPPTDSALFWIPERVARGRTFADLVATGYRFTILDQIDHLRKWYGAAAEQAGKYKINRINGVGAFMINDDADRFKFANSDGGLWFDTRRTLIDLARSGDQEQVLLVFDDWEAYAGRSFLSFNQGTDNPDNFNTNIRWLANKPWIEIVTLEDVASRGWTPIDRGDNIDLPFESYDFLNFATQGNYQNWYHGNSIEEDFDGFAPWIRQDLNSRGTKPFGALTTYAATAGRQTTSGPGTIAQDVFDSVYGPGIDNPLRRLARIGYSTATFETAWHDETDAERCPDGTYNCRTDNGPDAIAQFAKDQQFHNLRKVGLLTRAAQWALSSPAAVSVSMMSDIDHDSEVEFLLFNDRVFAVFENDGGRLILLVGRNPSTGQVAVLGGNLVGFPDRDDEWETDADVGARRISILHDRWAETAQTSQYVNDVRTVFIDDALPGGGPGGSTVSFASGDGKISRTVVLRDGSAALHVNYQLNPDRGRLYIRNGLVGDLLNVLETGQSALSFTSDATRAELRNTTTNAAVAVEFGTAQFNPAAGDGTTNTPRNLAMTHQVEVSGTGTFGFSITLDVNGSGAISSPSPSATPIVTASATATASISATGSPTASPSPSSSATATLPPTESPTSSATPSATITGTATPSATATSTPEPTESATASPTGTTLTTSPSPTDTATPTASSTPQPSSTTGPSATAQPPTASATSPVTVTPTTTGATARQIIDALTGRIASNATFDRNGDSLVDAGDIRDP